MTSMACTVRISGPRSMPELMRHRVFKQRYERAPQSKGQKDDMAMKQQCIMAIVNV